MCFFSQSADFKIELHRNPDSNGLFGSMYHKYHLTHALRDIPLKNNKGISLLS